MISLYARIAGNYFKPLGFKITYVMIALWMILAAWLNATWMDPWASIRTPMPFLVFFVYLPTVWLAAMGIVYLKEQLVTWQSSVVPDFRRPHLIVGAIFLAAALCMIPLLFKPFLYLDLLAAIALCAAGSSVLGWLVFDPSIKTIVAMFTALAALCFPQVQEAIGGIAEGELRNGAIAMIAGSVAIFAWIWWRLAHLREEMPAYGSVVLPGRHRAMTEIRGQFRNSTLNAIADAIARYPASRVPVCSTELDSFLSRVSHRRRVTAGGWVPWRLGALWSFALLLMLVCINFAFDANHRMKLIEMAPIIFIISMPAAPIITSSLWMRRAPMLAYELTLPVSRRSFVRGQMVALAWDHFSCWIGAMVTTVALGWIATARDAPGAVIHAGALDWLLPIAYYLAGQITALALIAWTLRFRSTLLSIFTMIFATILSFPPFYLTRSRGLVTEDMVLTISICIGVSVFVFADAYRRWLRVNFE